LAGILPPSLHDALPISRPALRREARVLEVLDVLELLGLDVRELEDHLLARLGQQPLGPRRLRVVDRPARGVAAARDAEDPLVARDRKSTRLNSSHVKIS